MIDHISVGVQNFEQSRDFYDNTLTNLGMKRVLNYEDDHQQWAGYGTDNKPFFEICFKHNLTHTDDHVGKGRGLHVCFIAPNTEAIQQWYTKCLELGAIDNGAPGPRPEYHPGYYAAFIIDPNGWRLEACCHNYQATPTP